MVIPLRVTTQGSPASARPLSSLQFCSYPPVASQGNVYLQVHPWHSLNLQCLCSSYEVNLLGVVEPIGSQPLLSYD